MGAATCYMCELPETSREHAPPSCFFPEQKGYGKDLRRGLITVPSCDAHNSVKSKDDEFMRSVIIMTSAPKSLAGRFQFFGKFLRAMRRRPHVFQSFFKDRGTAARGTGRVIQIDRPRFDRCVDNLARALFFHTYQRQWPHRIASISPNFYSGVESDQVKVHEPTKQGMEVARKFLESVPTQGENPEVFEYKIRYDEQAGIFSVAMRFYESFEVYAFSLLNETVTDEGLHNPRPT